MEFGTIKTEREFGGMLPTLVTYSSYKGEDRWMFLGTRSEARAFVARKVAEGYQRAWFGYAGATPLMVEQARTKAAQAA